MIQRTIKRGNVRTFDASYNKGFKTAQANEVDADFDLLVNAYNVVTAGIPAATVSTTAPTNPIQGQLWWRSDHGTLFIWYDDGTSAQWVQATPVITGGAVSGLEARVAALEAK
jgi:hypothetical protein